MTYDDGYDDEFDELSDEFEPATSRPDRYAAGDSDALLRRVIDIIATAPSFPLSSTPRIDRDEIIQLLQEALERLPNDLKEARFMIKDRAEFVAKARREAQEIEDAARQQAEPDRVLGHQAGPLDGLLEV